MTKQHIESKVRDFKMTMEDAARLADCFNSFDDSDSWPGGFTRGTPFTAERILENKQKSDDIRTIVAYDDDKIVGHCNVTPAEMDQDAAYVGILGVRPNYQGKGYGKAMLIIATETAAKVGKRRIELHTWPGNLKAMPLYKRVGFNWVPNTRVLMESYIPGILNVPLFREFFDRYYWYDALKREIAQVPDDITRNGIGVYEYHFRGDNGDTLDVIIDRHAKGICGFKITLDGETIEAKIIPESATGFIGLKPVPVKLIVTNGTNGNLEVSTNIDATDKLKVYIESPTQLTIRQGEMATIQCTYTIVSDTRPHSMVDPHIRTNTWTIWHLQINGKTTELLNGLIPKDAISITAGPDDISAVPGQNVTTYVTLNNNTAEDLHCIAIIGTTRGRKISQHRVDTKIKKHESIVHCIEIETFDSDKNSVVPVDIVVYVKLKRTKRIKNIRISIPVLGYTGALAYETIDGRTVLETESVRLVFEEGPRPVVVSIRYKESMKTAKGWMIAPLIGYPFPHEGGEWTANEYHPTYVNTGDIAEVIFTRESINRSGLQATFIYRAHASTGEVEVIFRLVNKSTSTITDLGAKISGWTSSGFDRIYIPLRGRFYCLSAPIWGRGDQVPDDPESFTESWYACQDYETNDLLGVVWNSEGLVKVKPSRKVATPDIEYKIPDLEPGESVEKHMVTMIFGNGTWWRVRRRWGTLNNITLDSNEPIEFQADLEATIVKTTCRNIAGRTGSPVIIDRSMENEMILRVEVVHKNPISGSVKITSPRGISVNGSNKIEFEIDQVSIKKPFVETITMVVEDAQWFHTGGEIVLEFSNRVERIPLTVIVYDSQVETERTSERYEEATLHSLSCGEYSIAASTEHGGSLVKYGPKNGSNLFYNTFPEVKPFVWNDKQYSGLNPYVQGHNIWDWESGIRKEKWTIENIDDEKYAGYRITSYLRHSEKVQGITISYEYKLLKGTPLLHIEMSVRNTSKYWRRFEAGVTGVPAIGLNEKDMIHLVRAGQRITYEPTPTSIKLVADTSEGWISIERTDGTVLGLIATCKTHSNVHVQHVGEAGHIIGFKDIFHLKPGSSARADWWLLVTDDVNQIITIKGISDS